jgi:hypothetical protein
MAPKPEPLRFVDSELIRKLAAAALPVLEQTSRWDSGLNGEDDERPEVSASDAHAAALSALTFCVDAIAISGDPSLWGLALELSEELEGFELYRTDDVPTAGLRGLVEAGKLPDHAEALLTHGTDAQRKAMAEALPLQDARSREQVRRLCADPAPAVRAEARARLATVEPLPWWLGIFEADPLAGLSEEEAARHRPALEALAAKLGERHMHAPLSEALPLAETLPWPARGEVLLRGLVGERARYTPSAEGARAGALLASGGPELGARFVGRLVASLCPALNDQGLLDAYLGALPLEARQAQLEAWLPDLRVCYFDEARDLWSGPHNQQQHALAEAVARHWDPARDPAPVLEAALARSAAEARDLTACALGRVLRRAALIEPLRARLEQALLGGFEGPWSELEGEVHQALARMEHARLRPLVKRLLERGPRHTLHWALQQRLGALHQPELDGPRAALVERLDDQPRLRPALRQHFVHALLPRLRAELLRGELEVPLAAQVLLAAGELYGGALALGLVMGPKLKVHHITNSEAIRTQWKEYLGPEAGQVPPTEAEWAALRAARARCTVALGNVELLLLALPDAPLQPVDRPLVEAALALSATDHSGRLVDRLAWVFYRAGGPEDVAAFETLDAQLGRFELDPGDLATARDNLKPYLRGLRARLGLAPRRKPRLSVVRPTPADDDPPAR